MPERIRISHSVSNTVNTCSRKLLFERKHRIFTEYGSIAMRYGSAFHKGMEFYYRNKKSLVAGWEAAAKYWKKPTVQKFNEDYRNLQSLLNSISIYHDQYQADEEEVFGEPENKLSVIISLTDEEKRCYGDIEVEFVVIIDLMLVVSGMKWVVDFKTTSVDLPYMAAKLQKMIQLMGYQFVAREHYEGVNGTMVYYHQLKATKSRKTGEYGAIKTNFMKFPQIYSNRDYADWRRHVIWNAFKLKKAAEADYPPDFGHCFDFNSTCGFMPLCTHPRWDIERFKTTDGFVIVPDERETGE